MSAPCGQQSAPRTKHEETRGDERNKEWKRTLTLALLPLGAAVIGAVSDGVVPNVEDILQELPGPETAVFGC